nr:MULTISPECIES: glycosyltransferase family 4 protein [unclassified Aliiroseovarius]
MDKNVFKIRHQIGVPTDAFVVSCIGAFRGSSLETSQKAQDVALRSFHLAFGNDLTAHLLFAGDGDLRDEAEALARKLGLTRNVHFLGNLADIHPLFKSTDLLFVPSRYEGLPMVGLEAGCAGVPVLASAIDELLDVGAPHGWVFSSDNSVEDFARKLAALREDRMVVRRRAREMSGLFRERYGINGCAQQYLKKIQELLKQPHRPLGQAIKHNKRSTDA